MLTKQQLIKYLESQIEMCQADIDGFVKEVKDNPYRAFEWSSTAMRMASKMEVYGFYSAAFTKSSDLTIEKVRDHVRDELKRKSRNVESSSSQVKNVIDRLDLKHYSELLEVVEAHLQEENGV